MRKYFENLIQHEVKLSAVFALKRPSSAILFIHTSTGGALSDIVLPGLVTRRIHLVCSNRFNFPFSKSNWDCFVPKCFEEESF